MQCRLVIDIAAQHSGRGCHLDLKIRELGSDRWTRDASQSDLVAV
jgi:hypothetical protein